VDSNPGSFPLIALAETEDASEQNGYC
jgi:hypothetical protein